MTAAVLIALVAVPALAFVLWPLLRKGRVPTAIVTTAEGRRDELNEDKLAIYRAIRELTFEYQAGYLAQDDYQALRARYETRASRVLKELDELEAQRPRSERLEQAGVPPKPKSHARSWTRSPLALTTAVIALIAFGVTLGFGVSRYTRPDRTFVPPGSRLPVPTDTEASPRGAPPRAESEAQRPISAEMLAGMLQAARMSLFGGRYQEAMTAYRAVLKRDPENVDALTHLAVIVAIGGHEDLALETIDRVLAVDPGYPPAHLYRGQILYEKKGDYRGAIKSWEQFVELVPAGAGRDRVQKLIQEARAQLTERTR
ncbi:MAG: tetratricopeptide repeat protein [Candidatus Methylomirabilia bacterium]